MHTLVVGLHEKPDALSVPFSCLASMICTRTWYFSFMGVVTARASQDAGGGQARQLMSTPQEGGGAYPKMGEALYM